VFLRQVKRCARDLRRRLQELGETGANYDDDDALKPPIVRRIKPTGDASPYRGLPMPDSTWRSLYKYQRAGLRWLWGLRCKGQGGILGDEMGLGKTVQVACLLQGLQLGGMLGPSLLVSPASLVSQWGSELRRWAPAVRYYVWHESGSSKSVAGWSVSRVIREAQKPWSPLGHGDSLRGARGPSIPLRGSLIITTYAGLRAAEAYLG